MSGCTVHYVDAEYDSGPIILQRSCPVLPMDTADDLRGACSSRKRSLIPRRFGSSTRGFAVRTFSRHQRYKLSSGSGFHAPFSGSAANKGWEPAPRGNAEIQRCRFSYARPMASRPDIVRRIMANSTG